MSDLMLFSEGQLRRFATYFPLSLRVLRVDDRWILSGIIFALRNRLRWRDSKGILPKQVDHKFHSMD